MNYYALSYQLDAAQRYLIWATDLDSDAKDVILLDGDECILAFDDLSMLQEYATENKLTITQEEPILHDLDWVSNWVRSPSPSTVNCVHVLAAWNLFADIWQSVKRHREYFRSIDEQYQAVYDKVFWGNNLPAVTPDGEHYVPEWNPDEIDVLRGVLSAGLEMFRKNLACTQDA